MDNRKIFLAVLSVLGLIILIGGMVLLISSETISFRDAHRCLEENEQPSFIKIKDPTRETSGEIEISVVDTRTNSTTTSFTIQDALANNYHPAETHKCGVYILRGFNFDFHAFEALPGFNRAIWFYDYSVNGTELIRLAGENADGDYSYDFRIDPTETYIALEQGYSGKENHALIIKNLDTGEDIFSLFARDIANENTHVVGSFGMLAWTDDGRYFWTNLFNGAYVNGFVRVDTAAWTYEVFDVPEGILGGFPLNVNTGYVPMVPYDFWTGADIFDEIVIQEYEKLGITADLYLYNVFSEESILIADTEATTWHFKSRWFSDSELQYKLPSGEVRTYTTQP